MVVGRCIPLVAALSVPPNYSFTTSPEATAAEAEDCIEASRQTSDTRLAISFYQDLYPPYGSCQGHVCDEAVGGTPMTGPSGVLSN
jgi:hypothetical protein